MKSPAVLCALVLSGVALCNAAPAWADNNYRLGGGYVTPPPGAQPPPIAPAGNAGRWQGGGQGDWNGGRPGVATVLGAAMVRRWSAGSATTPRHRGRAISRPGRIAPFPCRARDI